MRHERRGRRLNAGVGGRLCPSRSWLNFEHLIHSCRARPMALEAIPNEGLERDFTEFEDFNAGFDAREAQKIEDQRVEPFRLCGYLLEEGAAVFGIVDSAVKQ